MKAALCDCQTWMCQCVLVLVLVDRPAALWCSDLSLVASFRFTLWSSLFWFCCHVCWWQITATLQEDVFRCGPARFFVLSGGSQPVFESNDGITCSLNCLEVSRDFCNAFSAAVAWKLTCDVLHERQIPFVSPAVGPDPPSLQSTRHPSSNHLSFGWVSVAAAGVVRRGPAVWRWINIRR